MASFDLTPLNPHRGIEATGFDLMEVSAEHLSPELGEPEATRCRIEGRGIWSRFGHSRKRISEELSRLSQLNRWPDQHSGAICTNPVHGRAALCIASHAVRVDACDQAESEALLDERTAFCTQPRFFHAHGWVVGDVLLWDRRAVMRRGKRSPCEQPRRLASSCSSVRESDGRPPASRISEPA